MHADGWRRTMRPVLLIFLAILAVVPWILIDIMIFDAVFTGPTADSVSPQR